MMNGGPPYPLPVAAKYQSEPAKVNLSIAAIEQRANDAKKTVEELLYMLDLQEKVSWPDMLEKFSSLGNLMTQLQTCLKRSGQASAGADDYGALLRCHVLVPQRLQLEVDPGLQNMTGHRVHSWNHDVVPDYLRTKLNPDMEAEENSIELEKSNKGTDPTGVNRQITNMNKHVDLILLTLPNVDGKSTVLDGGLDKPMNSKEETVKLVRAVMSGDGLRAAPPSRPAASSTPLGIPNRPMGSISGPMMNAR